MSFTFLLIWVISHPASFSHLGLANTMFNSTDRNGKSQLNNQILYIQVTKGLNKCMEIYKSLVTEPREKTIAIVVIIFYFGRLTSDRKKP